MVTGILIVFGLTAGFIAGLLGVGGGIVLVPFLTWLLPGLGYGSNDAIQVAIATSLACILITGAVSAWAHAARKAVDWSVAQGLIPGLLLGSLGSGVTAQWLGGRVLAMVFAGFVVFAALRLLRPPVFVHPPAGPSLPLPLGALGIGWLSGLVGIGGGTLSVPYLCGRGLPIHRAVAVGAVVGVPIALSGSVGYGLVAWVVMPNLPERALGYVDVPAWLVLTLTGCLAAPWGAALAHRLPVGPLRRLFALVLLALAASMGYRIITSP